MIKIDSDGNQYLSCRSTNKKAQSKKVSQTMSNEDVVDAERLYGVRVLPEKEAGFIEVDPHAKMVYCSGDMHIICLVFAWGSEGISGLREFLRKRPVLEEGINDQN